MQYKHLLQIVVALAVSSAHVAAAQHPDDLQRGATEVCFVATQHFVTDMPDGYTPGHLRALLKKLSPQVIGVEAPSNVANPWDLAPLELAKVTKPWADKHGIVALHNKSQAIFLHRTIFRLDRRREAGTLICLSVGLSNKIIYLLSSHKPNVEHRLRRRGGVDHDASRRSRRILPLSHRFSLTGP